MRPHAIASLLVIAALPGACGSVPDSGSQAAASPAHPTTADPHHDHGRHHGHPTGDHDFSDAARWSKVFDDPARDVWQKPDEVVSLLAVSPGFVVADLGAGTGYFEKRLSAAVGPSGKVIALDVEKNMVDHMAWRAKQDGLRNVEPRLCPLDGTGLADASVDRVLVVDTWHHLGDRSAYARHLAAVLKPGGLVAVVDFTLDSPKGPPVAHRVAPEKVVEALAAAGLATTTATETLPDQYVVIGRKPAP